MRFLPALLLISLSSFAQTNYDTVRIRPVKITDQIYMLQGAGGNIGVFLGKEGTLMIDNQFAPLSNKINGAIKTLDPGEIRFAINTHLHGDHSGGNENFKRMGATLVAHDHVRERMMKETVNRAGNKVPPRNADAWPLITFADKLNFHLNEEDIVLHHLDRGHTDGDVIIQFTKANVVHTGDAFVRYGYPFIDLNSGGSVNGFVSTLDKILSLVDENTKIIPGHGELASKADVKKLRDAIADIRDQVAAALKKGKKPEDIPALGITDKYEAEYGRGFVKGKDFVLVVTESLRGGM
ncbi:MAG: MBL fold metallo-hydrolase [Cyclobacteriaceae bacterium]|nr:MBL fold metallo-hydrolase [Cyclobacteriaceae bacterium]